MVVNASPAGMKASARLRVPAAAQESYKDSGRKLSVVAQRRLDLEADKV
jgi:hypothetical protein